MPALRLFPGLFGAVALLFLSLTVFTQAAEGVREVNQQLRGLVYDPESQKLYGTTGTNNLIEIDPVSGETLATYAIGNNPSRVQLSAGHGLWVGLDGVGAVQRFNLDTLTAEEPMIIQPGGTIRDIAPSAGDPYTVVVVMRAPDQSHTAYALRNGQVLPDTVPFSTVAISGNSVFGSSGRTYLKAEIGASGLTTILSRGNVAFGDSEVFAELLYHPFAGSIYRSSDLAPQLNLLPGVSAEAVAINKQTDELFYLVNGPDWTLLRFDRPSLAQSGLSAFSPGQPNPGFVDLQAWGTNRVAFHTTNKLYLFELEKLFLPSDVEVFQQTQNSAFPFGTTITISVTVTNRGPGAAFQVELNSYLEKNEQGEGLHILRAFSTGAGPDPSSIRSLFGTVPAGTSRQFAITYLPRTPGILTNRVSVRSTNDLFPENNTNNLTVTILAPTNGIAKIPFTFVDVAFDARNGQVLAHDGAELWTFDPELPKIFDPVNNYSGATRIASRGGIAYVGFVPFLGGNANIARIPGPSSILGSGRLSDIEVSPADSNLVAVSSTDGTILYKDGASLPDRVPQFGYIGFSSDGAKLYRSNADNCDLDVFTVAQNGLSFEKTIPGVACSEFVAANGYLYFQNGLIFDPTSGARVPNTPIVPPPAFVSPSASGGFELLNRTNGIWILHRFRPAAGSGFEKYAEREIAGLTDAVLEVLALGRNHLAVNTASGLLLVNLPEDPTSIFATISRSGNETVLRFASTSGVLYRVESTSGLSPATWVAAQDNIVGTGAIVFVPISTSNQTAFYRITRLP